MSYNDIRNEIVEVLNKRDPDGRDGHDAIEIDHRGDVFHSGLGEYGTVILLKEQLDGLAALIAAARGLKSPE